MYSLCTMLSPWELRLTLDMNHHSRSRSSSFPYSWPWIYVWLWLSQHKQICPIPLPKASTYHRIVDIDQNSRIRGLVGTRKSHQRRWHPNSTTSNIQLSAWNVELSSICWSCRVQCNVFNSEQVFACRYGSWNGSVLLRSAYLMSGSFRGWFALSPNLSITHSETAISKAQMWDGLHQSWTKLPHFHPSSQLCVLLEPSPYTTPWRLHDWLADSCQIRFLIQLQPSSSLVQTWKTLLHCSEYLFCWHPWRGHCFGIRSTV